MSLGLNAITDVTLLPIKIRSETCHGVLTSMVLLQYS